MCLPTWDPKKTKKKTNQKTKFDFNLNQYTFYIFSIEEDRVMVQMPLAASHRMYQSMHEGMVIEMKRPPVSDFLCLM